MQDGAHKQFPEEEERIWVHFPTLGTGLSSGGFCSLEHPVLMRSSDCILIFWGTVACIYCCTSACHINK